MRTGKSLRLFRWRLSTELMLWYAIALAGIGAGIGAITYHQLLRPIEAALQANADMLADGLVHQLRKPLWVLDTASIQQAIERQALYPDLLAVRVETQFGDVLATWERATEAPPRIITATAHATYRGEPTGTVTVELSSGSIETLRQSIFPVVTGITLVGIGALFLLTILLLDRFVQVPLVSVASGLHRVSHGEYDVSLPPSRHIELQTLIHATRMTAIRIQERTEALNSEIQERTRAETELVEYRDHLEELIRQRTLALAEANRALRHEIEKRQKAQHAVIEAGTREQQRIGRDIHDTLGQHLVAARYMLTALERDLATETSPHATRTRQIADLLVEIMEQARSLAHGLMVVDLEEGGLPSALQQHADMVSRLFAIDCRLLPDNTNACATIDSGSAVQFVYIAREAINNAIRHGQASRIRLRLTGGSSGCTLLILDNGTGFDPDAIAGGDGMGLTIMRHRAESIGAGLRIRSRPGRGTAIRCCQPATRPPAA